MAASQYSNAAEEAMTEGANVDDLVEEALQVVPEELREDLRNWISRARLAGPTEVNEQLLREGDVARRAFESAANEVEKKLQE